MSSLKKEGLVFQKCPWRAVQLQLINDIDKIINCQNEFHYMKDNGSLLKSKSTLHRKQGDTSKRQKITMTMHEMILSRMISCVLYLVHRKSYSLCICALIN